MQALQQLALLLEQIPPLIAAVSETEMEHQPSANKWSKKQILGPLIDSATNNHHRFVRGQFDAIPSISYQQNQWNECSRYQQMPTADLLDFWRQYNQHLLRLLQLMPASAQSGLVNTGGIENHTIAFLVQDYVAHMEHHLKQIVDY